MKTLICPYCGCSLVRLGGVQPSELYEELLNPIVEAV